MVDASDEHPEIDPSDERLEVDAAALKALAHPLRVRLYELLSEEEAATASQLAARVGESSGSTSYHLRQLARHGFIEEDTERGNRRDRWWRRRPGGMHLSGWRFMSDPATADDLRLVGRELVRSYAEQLDRWYATIGDWGETWVSSSISNITRFEGTPEELAAVRDEVLAVLERHREAARRRPMPPGSARLTTHFHAFPTALVDPDETPAGDAGR